MAKKKIVGVKIDPTAGSPTNSKVYYYRTDEDLKIGDTFRAEMPTGGTPNVSVVEKPRGRHPMKKIKDLKRAK